MLKDIFTIDIVFSESHLIFPRITIGILIILGILIIIQKLIKYKKDGQFTKFKFFEENFDKFKFFGTLVLLIGYVFALELIGFLIASIIFVFITTLLFMGNIKPKSLITSGISSIATSFIFWYVFGQLINITLP